MSKQHVRYAGIALLGILSWTPIVYAEEVISVSDAAPVTEEEAGLEHGKINTPDASPVDPGHFEVESAYSYTHSKRFWNNNGDVHTRGLAREQSLSLSVAAGVIENFDVAVSGNYVWLKDKENDFDENDAVLGPESGHNFGDLDLSGRYRFLKAKNTAWNLRI